MGKAYDDLMAGLNEIVNDAFLQEDDYRAEAKAQGKKMVEVLAEQVDALLDVYTDYHEDAAEPFPTWPLPGALRGDLERSTVTWDKEVETTTTTRSSEW